MKKMMVMRWWWWIVDLVEVDSGEVVAGRNADWQGEGVNGHSATADKTHHLQALYPARTLSS